MDRKRKRPSSASTATVASKYFGGAASTYFHTSAPRKGSLPPVLEGVPHTLLLGTQASDNALDGDIPFFTNENCFWHILGDALGFRRGFHLRRTEAVDCIRPHLLHDEAAEVGYEEARRRLLAAGCAPRTSNVRMLHPSLAFCKPAVLNPMPSRFTLLCPDAVWDVVAESERAGSLDQDIVNPRYHDIRALCARHPSIERIGFVTGAGSAKIFRRGWTSWLAVPGAFRAAPDAASQAVFAKHVKPAPDGRGDGVGEGAPCRPPIELLVLESVSPAAVPLVAAKNRAKRVAAYTAAGRLDLVAAGAPRAAAYAWKRAMWLGSSAFPDGVLCAAAREARTFGTRPSDLLRDEAAVDVD